MTEEIAVEKKNSDSMIKLRSNFERKMSKKHQDLQILLEGYEQGDEMGIDEKYALREQRKNTILKTLLVSLCLIQTTFLNVSTFLPLYIDTHHHEMHKWQIGAILS
jgi:hypothetical protein